MPTRLCESLALLDGKLYNFGSLGLDGSIRDETSNALPVAPSMQKRLVQDARNMTASKQMTSGLLDTSSFPDGGLPLHMYGTPRPSYGAANGTGLSVRGKFEYPNQLKYLSDEVEWQVFCGAIRLTVSISNEAPFVAPPLCWSPSRSR